MANAKFDDTETWLTSLPPTPRQSAIALAVAAVLLVGAGVTALFADAPLPRNDAFIPAMEVAVILTDLITAALLFSQSLIYHSRALLALASGYLFTALIVIPHVLTFPGAFSPTGLLGAGLQSTGWLYVFWHLGFPAALLTYGCLKGDKFTEPFTQPSTLFAVGWSVAIVVSLVCALTWLAIAGERFLPRVFLDGIHIASFAHYVLAFAALICVGTLATLWGRRRSVLDQWLMVVTLAFLSELVINGLLISARFTLGFYASRIFSIATSTIVLFVLLGETIRLYARLAHSNMMLRYERNNKLMNLEAMAASISHEVRQPLAAIATQGGAALRFLQHMPPDLEEVRSSLNRIVSDSHRASQVFDSLRALFGKGNRGQEPVDMNEVVRGVHRILRSELTDHRITARIELTPEPPIVMGNKAQLPEVILNLVHNAVEAMASIKDDTRFLRVSSERDSDDAITVAVEDSGPGIDPKKLDTVFDAFITTKPHGMGLGLAICRMIVEHHKGRLSATPASPRGVIFRITLPQANLRQ